ncbi:Rieske 2Fe-2S domain-containing protein [Candidatus Giovannonibacteria bacterium]|nr:Rieske 2Fe-2S domain-containing protein [Candidatus Giovannonibacteria bacterium]
MARISEIPEGDGKIVKIDGKLLAIYNDGEKIKVFSTICPHARCDVEWNDAEKTWDCPCHGSRFEAAGKLLKGPAQTGLEEFEVKIDENGEIKLF